jgi:hypothetical protein
MKSLCIYEWRAWDGFLLPMIFPEASRLPARLGETSGELLQRLPREVRAFAFYVNLTDTRRVPLRRASFCRSLRARGVRILNEDVTDISKHRVQAACRRAGLNVTKAPREGDPDELVIVKTAANYGGEKEKFLSAGQRRVLRLAPRSRWIRKHDGYIIACRKEVRPELWQSRELIVERFIENEQQFFYRVHKALDRVIISKMTNPARIKKMLYQIPRTNWCWTLPSWRGMQGPAPHPLHVGRAVTRFWREFPLDFGAVDVLQDDCGECYIIDVNASPFWGEEGYDDMLHFLGGGLTDRIAL